MYAVSFVKVAHNGSRQKTNQNYKFIWIPIYKKFKYSIHRAFILSFRCFADLLCAGLLAQMFRQSTKLHLTTEQPIS
jgi:hypothetical protein